MMATGDDWSVADFIIATTRNRCDAETPGRTIASVGREGATFAVVKDMRNQVARVTANPAR